MRKFLVVAALMAACTNSGGSGSDLHSIGDCDDASWAAAVPGGAPVMCESACKEAPVQNTSPAPCAADFEDGTTTECQGQFTFSVDGVMGCCTFEATDSTKTARFAECRE
jgi:hypothetical protein